MQSSTCLPLDTSWGLISLSWVVWRRVYDVERTEIFDDSRTINEVHTSSIYSPSQPVIVEHRN